MKRKYLYILFKIKYEDYLVEFIVPETVNEDEIIKTIIEVKENTKCDISSIMKFFKETKKWKNRRIRQWKEIWKEMADFEVFLPDIKNPFLGCICKRWRKNIK